MNKEQVAPRVKIKLSDDVPETVEVLADSVVRISEAMAKIKNSRLTRGCIVSLIKDGCYLSKKEINIVLDLLEDLEKMYLKPKKP